MGHLSDKRIKELEIIANQLRISTIEMVAHAGSGHQGGPLGMADVFAVLYFHALNHDPKNPAWEDRDRLILSNGHACPIRYAAMAESGYFPAEELKTLRRLGSRLQGHPERLKLPGAETTSGPLGAGLAQATGLAYAGKMDKKKWRVFCQTSDGEHEAGLHWEAMLFAGKYRLDNLVCNDDRNNIQIDGRTEDIMPLEPLRQKYEAFNWHVIDCDGNNVSAVVDALEATKSLFDKPICVLTHNIPGKGVSYMENNFIWHSQPFKPGQAEAAVDELKAVGAKLEAELAKL